MKLRISNAELLTLYAILQERKAKGIAPTEASEHVDSMLRSITSHIMAALEKHAPSIKQLSPVQVDTKTLLTAWETQQKKILEEASIKKTQTGFFTSGSFGSFGVSGGYLTDDEDEVSLNNAYPAGFSRKNKHQKR